MFLLLLLLVGGTWFLSPWATAEINRNLATLPGYRAHVGSVRIAIWKSALDLEDFEMTDRAHPNDGPVVKIAHGTMFLLPGALIRGKIRGHGSIRDSELLIVEDPPGPAKDDSLEKKAAKTKDRTKQGNGWQHELQQKFSLEISRFEISHTKIRFLDRSLPHAPELRIEDFHLVVTDLKEGAKGSHDLPSHFDATGRFAGGGNLDVHADLAPLETPVRFKSTVEVKDLALPPLHDFLRQYASVDVTRGIFEVYIAADSAHGHYEGYVKPFLQNLEFKAVTDPKKSFLQNAGAKVASAAKNLLKNKEQKIATKAPFQGDLDRNQVDVWATLENLLRNAFVQSLREGFEQQTPG